MMQMGTRGSMGSDTAGLVKAIPTTAAILEKTVTVILNGKKLSGEYLAITAPRFLLQRSLALTVKI